MATTQVHIGKTTTGTEPAASSTTFAGVATGVIDFNPTEAEGRQVWATDGLFGNLLITLTTAPGAGKSWTFTVRKNGADTALVVIISDSATSGRDTTHSVAVAPGDVLALKAVPSGTPSTTSLWITVAVDFTGTNTGESGYSGQMPAVELSQSAARYQGVFRLNNGFNTTSPTSGSARSLAAAAGDLTALYVLLSAAPGASKSYTFAIYKNGTRQDGAGATVDTRVTVSGAGVTTGSATFVLPVAPGDVLTLEALPSGTPALAKASVGVRFRATTDGESQFCGCTSAALSPSVTNYTRVPTASAITWSSSESGENDVKCLAGITAFRLSGFQMRGDTAPGAAKSYTYSLRRNVASPAGTPTVVLSGTVGNGADTTNGLDLVEGDSFNLRAVPAGTPTVPGATQWGFIQTIAAAPTGTAQLTQFVAETLSSVAATTTGTARLTQLVAETLILPPLPVPGAQLTQFLAEVLTFLPPVRAPLQATQLLAELVTVVGPSPLAATQVAAELVLAPSAGSELNEARVTALACELIIVPRYVPPPRLIRRLRRAPHLQQEHTRIAYARFALDLQRGIGLPTGYGSDPLVTLRLSRDGGKTWGEPVTMRAGRLGAYTTRALARRLGQARDAVFEVTVSDPVAWSLVQAWLDLEPGSS